MEKEKRLIDANMLKGVIQECIEQAGQGLFSNVMCKVCDVLDACPTVDAVEVKTIKAWLYQIAMNNVGIPVKDFATACEEIISRLDGLRGFAKEENDDGK